MENHAITIKAAVASFFAFLTALWGWFGWLIAGWVLCMAIDYISGSIAASKNGEWNSARAREGLAHKGGMILVVIVAGGADLLLGFIINSMGIQLPIMAEYTVLVCPLAVCWYIVTELGSIVENAVALGAPCPSFLETVLKIMKTGIKETANKLTGTVEEEGENTNG